MSDPAATSPGPLAPDRLLAIIELQNAIAATSLSGDGVLRLVVERALGLTGASAALVAVVEGDHVVCRVGAGASKRAIGQRWPLTGAIAACLSERRPHRASAGQAELDDAARARTGAGDLLWAPLVFGEHAVGLIEVVAPTGALTGDAGAVLSLLAHIVAIALHRAQTYPRAKLDELHDTISGLGNRRAYDDRAAAELSRLERYGHAFSLAMIRLGELESVVDRHGQPAADDVVREVAGLLEQGSRAIDACFRVSAGDFAVVMPGTGLVGAQVLAERFRQRITDAVRAHASIAPRVGVIEAGREAAADLTDRAIAALR
ncbi:MAG: diguanylate cyclase [Kofleriaceae bacterium]|jgi:diguanylate cyclase (GGDEF)-like protein|nr:diguanylate cyclase [Kofleriaceae bacterium]MBP6836707.1 diguanylate cyclase [Kofleriaceae bacterium]MBP9203283.1 diguanylate cyclase [Kofleriaceae bacterium]